MKIDPIQAIDFYKSGHVFQYPENTTAVYSNFTPRSGRLAQKSGTAADKGIVWFGLQGFIKWFLIDCFNENFFYQPLEDVIAKYKRRMTSSLVLDDFDTSHIEKLHKLGYLPLEILALEEGTVVPYGVPAMTIVNTHPTFYWLTNYIESVLSSEVWKACTSATTALQYRLLLETAAKETGSPLDFVLWQGHDFSFRGLSGVHDASSSGAGHLLSFFGTDTVPAIDYLENYYGADSSFIAGSVPATEHSVMCMGGKETEIETFRRLIDTYPTGVLSVVSDTWDFWKVITETASELKEEILARQPNAIGLAKVVFRPDSGDPVAVLTGYDLIGEFASHEEFIANSDRCDFGDKVTVYSAVKIGEEYLRLGDGETLREAEVKGAVQCLYDIFGGTETETGHKMLDSHVGLIYGDSITIERAKSILSRLAAKGFASGNVVFGIGSYTYQHVTRDTHGFAVKSTAGVVDSKFVEIFKDPVTDNGVKKSAKGLLAVFKDENGELKLADQMSLEDYYHLNSTTLDQLKLVFADGVLTSEQTAGDIRKKVNDFVVKNT
jgi:nicotinamide phosphoribosyltransferase